MTRNTGAGRPMTKSGHCAWPTLDWAGVSSHCRCRLATCTCSCHEVVTVCSECRTEACWAGDLYCEGYRNAGTVEVPRHG